MNSVDPLGLDCLYPPTANPDPDQYPDAGTDPGQCEADGGAWVDHNDQPVDPPDNGLPTSKVDVYDFSPDFSPDQGVFWPSQGNADIAYSGYNSNAVSDGSSDTAQWLKNFATSFVKDFSLTGQNGKTLCTVVAINNIRDELNPFVDNKENVAESALDQTESVIKVTAGLQASAYSVARGLTVPLRSSIYRGILGRGLGVAEIAGERVVPVVAAAFAYKDIAVAGYESSKTAAAGGCAGVFE